ncbi:MAG: hypothetical protein IJS39_13370 [Synergistaceae bacterium]|nr:hypothetical protein [Synergistaceae bacterium]
MNNDNNNLHATEISDMSIEDLLDHSIRLSAIAHKLLIQAVSKINELRQNE